VGDAAAGPVTLDFSSGAYAIEQGTTFEFDTYNQSGFKLTVITPFNHIDPNYLLAGPLGFHNGPFNPTEDNDLILTFSGGAFDFDGLDIAAFDSGASGIDLFGSNGASAAISSVGFTATPGFSNVTFVRFSMPFAGAAPGVEGVIFNSMLVDNEPTGEVPEPSSMILFTLGALGCAGAARRRRNLENAA